jgi:conjugal transfer pilus assembly protein TraW
VQPKFARLPLLLVLIGFTNAAPAKDFVVKGPVYPIQEQNLLVQMKSRFDSMEASGEWQKIKDEMISTAREKTSRPTPVSGISPAKQSKTWEFDPSFTVKKDIVNHVGQLITKAGTTINPLDTVSLDVPLLFIDGDSKTEKEFAKKHLRSNENHVKIVLVNGSVSDVTDELAQPIYFDQKGLLTTRFGITHTPAYVQQAGRVLEVGEVAL